LGTIVSWADSQLWLPSTTETPGDVHVNIEVPVSTEPLDPTWLEPLQRVARALVASRRPSDRAFDPADFMVMGRIVRRSRPTIVLYKHAYTRMYLNLDAAGHAYRYHAPLSLTSTGSGRYLRHRDLLSAIDHLRLWEVPALKAVR
jgi:hypothetical protein